ncbi:MAG: hypothetical protein PHY85_04220 [Bacteroidales bacterium]|nr:hypothetical protein [Bacteroidales bacterium]
MDLFIKKYVLLILFFLVFEIQAQVPKLVTEEEVPFFVKKTLRDLYPSVEILEWNELSGNYTAKVNSSDSPGRINITGGGSFMSSEWDLEIKYLPLKISNYLKENLPKFRVIRLFVEKKAKSSYVVELYKKRGKLNKTLIFSLNGDFIEEKK